MIRKPCQQRRSVGAARVAGAARDGNGADMPTDRSPPPRGQRRLAPIEPRAGLRVLVAIACVAALALGCDRREAAGSAAGGAAPAAGSDEAVAAEFEAFATRFTAAVQATLKDGWRDPTNDGPAGGARSLWLQGRPQIDVRRTDSLVAPFLGELRLKGQTVHVLPDDKVLGGGIHEQHRFTFGRQKGVWVLQGAVADSIYVDGETYRPCDLLDAGTLGAGRRFIRDAIRSAATQAATAR